MFEPVAVIGAYAHIGMHVETGDLCASLAAQKAMNRNATTKVGLELVKHEGGQFAAS